MLAEINVCGPIKGRRVVCSSESGFYLGFEEEEARQTKRGFAMTKVNRLYRIAQVSFRYQIYSSVNLAKEATRLFWFVSKAKPTTPQVALLGFLDVARNQHKGSTQPSRTPGQTTFTIQSLGA